jgi:hypothetical protein
MSRTGKSIKTETDAGSRKEDGELLLMGMGFQ